MSSKLEAVLVRRLILEQINVASVYIFKKILRTLRRPWERFTLDLKTGGNVL